MSYTDVVARIQAIESLAAAASPRPVSPPAAAGGDFASVLAGATGDGGRTLLSFPGAGGPGSPLVAVAAGEIGQAEQVPGSNDGPRIALYRSAVAGAQPGDPWCADFVSWVAAQAGLPLGDAGQGLGSVAGIAGWAARSGRLLPANAAAAPGDLVLFGDRHVGLVETVEPDGSLDTIEGNEGDAVRRAHHAPGEWTGLVRLGA